MHKSILVALLVIGSLSGCSTWDDLSHREKSAVVGAGAGGVAGSVLTGGSVLGTVGGAAVGGVVGNEVGK